MAVTGVNGGTESSCGRFAAGTSSPGASAMPPAPSPWSKREADKALATFVAELNQGAPLAQRGRTFGDLLDRWFHACSNDWSPGTAYQTHWIIDHRLSGLRERPLHAINAAELDKFYAALRARGGQRGTPLSVSSVRASSRGPADGPHREGCSEERRLDEDHQREPAPGGPTPGATAWSVSGTASA